MNHETIGKVLGALIQDERDRTNKAFEHFEKKNAIAIKEALLEVKAIKGEKGEKGDKGDKGEDGISPSSAAIAELLMRDKTFTESLRGPKGEDGKPAPQMSEAELQKHVKTVLVNHMEKFWSDVEELVKRHIPPPIKGDKGEDGKDAPPVDIEKVASVLKRDEYFTKITRGEKGDTGPKGDAGDKGEPGKDGVSPTPERIAALIKTDEVFVKTIRGEKGDAGERGKDGNDADPVEVAKTLLNDEDFIEATRGLDLPVIEPYKVTAGMKLERNSFGLFNGALWQTTRKAKGTPDEDPSSWRLILNGVSEVIHEYLPERKSAIHIDLSDGTRTTHVIPSPPRFVDREVEDCFVVGDFTITEDWKFGYYGPDKEWRYRHIVGPKGDPGERGRKGLPGVGIKSIKSRGSILEGIFIDTEFTDGEVQSVELDMDVEIFKDFILQIAVPPVEEVDAEIRRFAGRYVRNNKYLKGDIVNAGHQLVLALKDTSSYLDDRSSWVFMFDPAPGPGGGSMNTASPFNVIDSLADLPPAGKGKGDTYFNFDTGQILVWDEKNGRWKDLASKTIIVADKAAREGTPAQPPGATLFQRDTNAYYVADNGWKKVSGGASDPKDQTIYQRLVYDPEKPSDERIHWDDARQAMAIVDDVSDLSDRTVLPLSHLQPGKLVFVRSTGSVFELIKDAATMGDNIMDWKPLLGGLTFVGRYGDLPHPTKERLVDGQQAVIRMAFDGEEIYRLVAWDEKVPGVVVKARSQLGPVLNQAELESAITPIPGGQLAVGDYAWVQAPFTVVGGPLDGTALRAGQTLMWSGDPLYGINGWSVVTGPTPPADITLPGGRWRFLNRENFVRPLRTSPDQDVDAQNGDFRSTVENMHKELKVYDGTTNAWVDLFTEDNIRAWIAALSLFQGTVQEPGGVGINVPEFGALPDLTKMSATGDLSMVGHYWTYTGSAGRAVVATDPSIGTDLKDTILQPGDWVQIANIALAGQPPVLKWVRVGGDLLAKSRGDLLYGLKTWTAGGWEKGSVVVHRGDVYRATRDTSGADPDPSTVGSPWELVDISGGLKVAPTDTDLPATAAAGQVWIVLQSALAGGRQALYAYDNAANKWQELGGSGVPLELSGGEELINIGLPVGAISPYVSVKTIPNGWLLCDGSPIPPQYKELIAICGANLPDLRDQFIRGAKTQEEIWDGDWKKNQDTTRMPRNKFQNTAVGAHQHALYTAVAKTGDPTFDGGSRITRLSNRVHGTSEDNAAYQTQSGPITTAEGAHNHNINGGDPETAPVHIRMAYIIKAADRFVRERVIV